MILYLTCLLSIRKVDLRSSEKLFKFYTIIHNLVETLNYNYYLKLSITKYNDKYI